MDDPFATPAICATEDAISLNPSLQTWVTETEDYQRNLFDLETQRNAAFENVVGRGYRSRRRHQDGKSLSLRALKDHRGKDPLHRTKAAGCVSPAVTAGCGTAVLLSVAPEDVHLHEQRGQRALQSRPPL